MIETAFKRKVVISVKIPVYRFRMDYLTLYSEFNPLLLFAQKYEFGTNEASPLRKCYANVVVLVESGKGTLTLEQKDYQVQPGSLVHIAAGAVHRWVADPQDPMVHRCAYFDWKYVSRPGIRFQRDYFRGLSAFNEELCSHLPGLELREVTRVNNIPLWVSYFNSLTPPPELLGRRNPLDSLQYNGAFQIFLYQYLSFTMKTDVLHDPRIKKILFRIEQVSLTPTDQELYQWAKDLGLGRSRFHDLFKKETGFSPGEYIRQLKYDRIIDDLCLSTLTITEIAQKYGFSTIHYFSKAFRNKMGMPPTEYRLLSQATAYPL